MDKYVILEVTGGIGKNVVATSVLKPLKEKYKDREIIVVSSWPEVFLYHPIPHTVYKYSYTPNFYNKYIESSDSIFIRHDPYSDSDFINGKVHLIESFFKICGLERSLLVNKPDVHMNSLFEDRMATHFSNIDKPLMVIQTHGGGQGLKDVSYAWPRDIPKYLIEDIIKRNKEKYHIVEICNKGSQRVDNDSTICTPDITSTLDVMAILKMSKKRLLIDSFLQHIAASWDLPSTVLWIGTSPHQYGYSIHDNILPHVAEMEGFKTPNAYFRKYKLEGSPDEYPFKSNKIFDANIVQESIEKQ